MLDTFFNYFSHTSSSTMVAHQDPIAPVLIWVTIILSFALVGRYVAMRFHQSGVLGELLMGVLLGNLGYHLHFELMVVLREGTAIFSILQSMLQGMPLEGAVQSQDLDPSSAKQILTILQGSYGGIWVKVVDVLDIFSRYGVVFLLFIIGLDSSIAELKRTGRESMQVAILGVIAPVLLGFLVTFLLIPGASYKTNLFVAAALSATSVGITARVLREMKQLQTREAKTILGAAVIDDILGLIILAVISALVVSGEMDALLIPRILISAVLFFAGVLFLGPWVFQHLIRFFNVFLEPWEVKLFASFIFVSLLAWLATLVDLAAIIGAFSAGLIMHDNFFNARRQKNMEKRTEQKELQHKVSEERKGADTNIKSLLRPFEAILVPLFFIIMGIQVKLELLMNWPVLAIACALTIAAIVGKLAAGYGGSRQDDRWLIGIGMMPRGEVGLIFASIGKTLGVLSDQLFSAIVLMVIITTFITPMALKSRYQALSKLKKHN